MEQTYKDEISTIVREYGSLYDDGFDVLARGNEVEFKVSKSKFRLKFTMKNPAKMQTEVTLSREKPYSFTSTDLKHPELIPLNNKQLDKVDTILKKEKDLWLITSMNNLAVHYDTSEGYKSIAKQKLIFYSNLENDTSEVKIKTHFNQPFAVIYYQVKYSNDFAIWIDLEEQQICGATWLEFPQNKGGLISKEDFNFIDQSLKKNGSFGVYGNVTEGLRSLIEYFEVNIDGFEDPDNYWMSVIPKDGHGHFLHFDINKKNGEIGSPIAGHSIPAPEPPDLDP